HHVYIDGYGAATNSKALRLGRATRLELTTTSSRLEPASSPAVVSAGRITCHNPSSTASASPTATSSPAASNNRYCTCLMSVMAYGSPWNSTKTSKTASSPMVTRPAPCTSASAMAASAKPAHLSAGSGKSG